MKVSIITVCYNSAKTISDTIESVLAQTYSNIEYIIVDGASIDQTVDIIKKYEPQFEGRIKWMSESDKGLYEAINKGIRLATGDIVGIINSDDFYHRKEIIDKVVATMKTQDVDAVYGDCIFVNGDNLNKVVRYYRSGKNPVRRFRFGFMPSHPTFFTYRENFNRFGYYKEDYKISADFELLVRFMYVNKIKARYIPIDFFTMRTGGISTASYKSNILLNKEDVRACRENGIWTCFPLLMLRYFIKIWELIFIPKTKNINDKKYY